CTGSFFMADTQDYVESILAFQAGRDYSFWDFAHVLWRPLGWLLWEVFRPLAMLHYPASANAAVTFVLIALNWIAGLVTVVLMHALVCRYSRSTFVANFVTFAFICSQAFLNFVHTGAPYVTGLAFLVAAFSLM